MRTRIPYDRSIAALLRPAENTVFFDGWEDPEVEDRDLLCAEMSRLAYAGRDIVAAALARVGFELIDALGGEGLVDRLETGGTEGFLATNTAKKLTVLAFRGTEAHRLEDIVTDAMTLQVRSDLFPGCRVHSGFADRFERVADQVGRLIAGTTGTLLITGHSLGAALATLAAVRAKDATLVTFGSPLVGDRKFGELLAQRAMHRFVDCCDVVARVPPARFDAAHLRELLGELANVEALAFPESTAARLAIDGVAVLLAAGFDAVDRSIAFSHVGKPRCILEDGTVATMDETAFGKVRTTARTNYLRGQLRLAPSDLAGRLTRSLENARAHAGTDPIKALGAIIADLMAQAGAGSVPIRDLADHAPINYVSAFTGRE